ncbi:MAG: hypothetical protein JRI80_00100 [Deltaproteobacteria bacterium]|nr:hypothetical protein [Deltaproteobacteria bacterium]
MPPELCDICREWVVGKCLLGAYGHIDQYALQAYDIMTIARRRIVGANIGKNTEELGLNQSLSIMGADGVLCSGTSDLIQTSAYEPGGADDDYHDIGGDDLNNAMGIDY